MFQITETSIRPSLLRKTLLNPSAGAFVAFEGWVRNVNDGQTVQKLCYEAYPFLAETEGVKILEEAHARFNILGASSVHRVGLLEIADMAIWVGVTAEHRSDAFLACQYIIDNVKTRLPIWKKEYYTNGDSGWVNCQQCALASSIHTHKEASHAHP